jgi:Holliday junction DNA helicase RuvB
MELNSWVFATANSCNKIIQPLLSRFAILEMPGYTFEEFMEISLIRLRKENVIAEKVWNQLNSRDIRDVIKVARLASSIEDTPFVIKVLKKRITKSQY